MYAERARRFELVGAVNRAFVNAFRYYASCFEVVRMPRKQVLQLDEINANWDALHNAIGQQLNQVSSKQTNKNCIFLFLCQTGFY